MLDAVATASLTSMFLPWNSTSTLNGLLGHGRLLRHRGGFCYLYIGPRPNLLLEKPYRGFAGSWLSLDIALAFYIDLSPMEASQWSRVRNLLKKAKFPTGPPNPMQNLIKCPYESGQK